MENDVNVKTVGFKFETDKKYIYESPDGGKTIYRREMGVYDEKRELIQQNAPMIAKIMEHYGEEQDSHINKEIDNTPSEIDMLKQQVLNLTMANSELKDMLRQQGVDIV